MKEKLMGWVRSLIPGVITAAVVFGPSKVTITSKLGALYGSSLLWIVVVAIFFMAIYTNMSARIGLASNKSFLTIVRDKWGKWFAGTIGVGIFLVTTSFQIGNAVGAGIAVGEFTHMDTRIWIVLTSLAAMSLLFAKKFYALLSKLMIGIILLMLLSFLITCLVSHPSKEEILQGFVPTVPAGSEGLVVAFVASCFSLVGALYQSYLVQQRTVGMSPEGKASVKDRSLTGMLVLGVMSVAVMLCASAVLHPKGIDVKSAKDMGMALEPLYGRKASTLFLLGLFGSSFSTLVGNAVLGGTLFSDAFLGHYSLDSWKVKASIACIMFLGATLACIFGSMPLQMIVFAQSVTILVVPVIGWAILRISNDKKVMGDRVNSPFLRPIAIAGLCLVILLAIFNIYSLFFK